jgi:hypothetical protein
MTPELLDATPARPAAPPVEPVRAPRRGLRATLRAHAGILAIWALGAIAIALATRGIVKWYVMTDELSYLKQSIFIGRHFRLPLAGDPYYNSHSELLPLVGAPFLALFSIVIALKLFHVLAAILLASTAVPVYLLARRVTRSQPLALLAGALAVSVPWAAMAVTFMSEIVAYPVAAWALLAIHDACVRPGDRRDAVALLAIALACFARAQLVVLAPVLVACVVVHELACAEEPTLAQRLRALPRRHRLLTVVAALGVLGVVLVLTVSSFADALLGNYATTTHSAPTGLAAIWRYTRFQLATHVVAVGVLPFALGLAFALAGVADRRDRAVQAASTLVLVGGTALLAQAGWFTAHYISLDDRYLLYLAPLLIVGFAGALAHPWRLRFTALPAALATWFALDGFAIGPSPLFLNSISTANYEAIQHWVSKVTTIAPARALTFAGIAGLALTVGLGRLRGRRATLVVVGLPFLAVSLLSTANIFQRVHDDWWATRAGTPNPTASRGWVDRAVGGRTPVAALLGDRGAPGQAPYFWWDTSYFNKALAHAYVVLPGGEELGQNYATQLRIDTRSGALENLRERYAVVPQRFVGFGIRGARVVRREGDLALLAIPARPHVAWRMTGQSRVGTFVLPTRPARLTVYGRGRCEVTLRVGAPATTTRPLALAYDGAAGSGHARVIPHEAARIVRLQPHVGAAGSASIELRASSAGAGVGSGKVELLGLTASCPAA